MFALRTIVAAERSSACDSRRDWETKTPHDGVIPSNSSAHSQSFGTTHSSGLHCDAPTILIIVTKAAVMATTVTDVEDVVVDAFTAGADGLEC
jgi:hypothetical protein